MRATKLDRIDYRVFRSFEWSEDLADLASFNLVYSPNGTGKSTLAEVLRHLMDGEPLHDGEAVLSSSEGRLHLTSSSAPTGLADRIRVFDSRYRHSNLATFAGIHWTIGKEAVDAAAETERLSNLLRELNAKVEVAEAKQRETAHALESFCDGVATELRSLKRLLPGAGAATYSVTALRTKLDARSPSDAPSELLEPYELKRRRALIEERQAFLPINLSEDDGPRPLGRLIEASGELGKEAAAHAARTDPGITGRGRWLLEGLRHLGEGGHSAACPFCLQEMPKAREATLREALGHGYERLPERIAELNGEAEAARVELRTLGLPDPVAVIATQRADYEVAVRDLKAALAAYNDMIQKIENRLSAAANGYQPDTGHVLEDDSGASMAWRRVLDAVASHNAQIEAHESSQRQAFDLVEQHTLAVFREEYLALGRDVAEAAAVCRHARETRDDAVRDRRVAEATAQRIDLAVDALNADLSAYLGHGHIRVEVLDDGYQILREGVPASQVSEGERTAITFLHFLRSLDDANFRRDDALVVVDDPVSSLDSSALHSAAAFLIDAIHDRASNRVRGQVIVTTHNFAFFRLLRDWAARLKKEPAGSLNRAPARFYSIGISQSERGRCARLIPLDPLLLRFNSEYHYLFSRVSGYQGGEEALYCLNLARRLIEAFLAFRVPRHEGDLRVQLDDLLDQTDGIGPEQQQRLRMLFNTGSHSVAIPDLSDQLAQIDEVEPAIRAVLALMEAADPGHFAQMTEICQPSGSS